MLITEESLKRAIEKFIAEARIPRPQGWSKDLDRAWLDRVVVPAFFDALKEIEDVEPCYGFSLKNIHPNKST